jgi:hypothetical protein
MSKMTWEMPTKKPFYQREGAISAVSIGLIFIIVGLIYLLYQPNDIVKDIISFISNFTLAALPGTSISLPVPVSQAADVNLYTAVFEFCLGVGATESIILLLRLSVHSHPRRIGETVANMVVWFGSGYMVYSFLVTAPSTNKWFVFWAGVIIIFGLSLVTRAFVILGYKWKKQVAASTFAYEPPTVAG